MKDWILLRLCPGCGCDTDPDTCGCGGGPGCRPDYDGHAFVPMGCRCFYPVEERGATPTPGVNTRIEDRETSDLGAHYLRRRKMPKMEPREEAEAEPRYTQVYDGDGHPLVIPADKAIEWSQYLVADSMYWNGKGPRPTVPKWAKRIEGRLTFTNPRLE